MIVRTSASITEFDLLVTIVPITANSTHDAMTAQTYIMIPSVKSPALIVSFPAPPNNAVNSGIIFSAVIMQKPPITAVIAFAKQI